MKDCIDWVIWCYYVGVGGGGWGYNGVFYRDRVCFDIFAAIQTIYSFSWHCILKSFYIQNVQKSEILYVYQLYNNLQWFAIIRYGFWFMYECVCVCMCVCVGTRGARVCLCVTMCRCEAMYMCVQACVSYCVRIGVWLCICESGSMCALQPRACVWLCAGVCAYMDMLFGVCFLTSDYL